MEKVRYMISDASNLLKVESHVLRYWEEELELDIPRNEMGHRYYTEENIHQFEQIRKLKEEGYQLKAIRMLVHNKTPKANLPEQTEPEPVKPDQAEAEEQKNVVMTVHAETPEQPSKLEQFQMMMNEIVRNAIAENNHALGQAVSTQVGDRVLKEMNYLMREREEQEEERFRKLDESLRGHQKRAKAEKTAKPKKLSRRERKKAMAANR